VYVNYVRRKLADAGCEGAIETVRGIGYRFTSCGDAEPSG
jgi:two-component system OmpR family response regulator/two-component system response regulator MprA